MRVSRQIGQSTEANLMYLIIEKMQQIIDYLSCCNTPSPVPEPPVTTTTTTEELR